MSLQREWAPIEATRVTDEETQQIKRYVCIKIMAQIIKES